MMKRLLLASLLLSACGEPTSTITVRLLSSTTEGLDPFDPDTGLAKVRISIDGPDQHDDAFIDRGPGGERTAIFDMIPSEAEVTVRANGYDAFGNVVAYGRVEKVALDGDVSVDVPFRRNLAYVIHQPVEGQDSPEGWIYVIDVASRTFVSKLKLPGTAPEALGISARGGDAILITYRDGGTHHVGVLSADTHEIKPLQLTQPQTLAVASPLSATAVVAGGNFISFLNLDGGMNEVFPMQVGGVVKDAAVSSDGSRAIVVLDTAALDIDVTRREVKQLSVLPDPSGVALGLGGQVAYLTSSTEGTVAAIELEGSDAGVLPNGALARGVEGATFSDEMQAVFGANVDQSNGSSRVVSFHVPTQTGLTLDEGTQALPAPAGIATGAGGRRVIVVSAGTSSATAGLTVIDTFPDAIPDGSSTLYPLDPDDTFTSPGGAVLKQRWRPRGVAVIYGR